LAGLEIDLLQKMRQGHITLGHLEWFNNLSKEARDALVVGEKLTTLKPAPPVERADLSAQAEKFALLVDLGIIMVPDDYEHATRLASFSKENRKKFYYYNDAINDVNFPNPSRILKAGEKLRVRAFRQIVLGTTTSEERMEFLATQKAIYTGAQGASLVFEQKRGQLPKGFWYVSFDEKDHLWEDAGGCHRVPVVNARSDGDFNFDLGSFEDVWGDGDALLCFCDLSAE